MSEEPLQRVGVVVVTHGDYGPSMLDAVRRMQGADVLEGFESVAITPGEPRGVITARVQDAVHRLDHGGGVLILCDLYGSTPWSCAMEAPKGAVVLCGLSLPMLVKVASVKRHGITPEALAQAASETATRAIKVAVPKMIPGTVVVEDVFDIVNELGLHARAATKFVQTANRFKSDVEVEKDGQTVNGKSIMGVLMLVASKGTAIRVRCSGPDAEACLAALRELVAARFGEDK